MVMSSNQTATRPPDHPQRQQLLDEVHSRPSVPIATGSRVSHLVMMTDELAHADDLLHLKRLLESRSVAIPRDDARFFTAELGAFVLKWERHSEFTSYTFIRPGLPAEPFSDPAIEAVPADWLASLPGLRMVAAHLRVETAEAAEANEDGDDGTTVPSALFGAEGLIGGRSRSGGIRIFSDLRAYGDGYVRYFVQSNDDAIRTGRFVQRLLELETYRLMTLLGFPVARSSGPEIARIDQEARRLTWEMAEQETEHLATDRQLLSRLIDLAASAERLTARTSYRYEATQAYYNIVQQRLQSLELERIDGVQRFDVFLDRRLSPAVATCASTGRRQEDLAERIIRVSSLLRSRVDLAMAEQNRGLLHSMDTRASLQLRLQETVEGLSVAAISYYLIGLLNYGFKGAEAAGVSLNVTLATGLTVPVVVLAVWWSIRQARQRLTREAPEPAVSDASSRH